MRRIGLVLSLLACGSASAVAARSDPAADALPEVVVEGRRVTLAERERMASAFVDAVAGESRRGRLTRWSRSVCPGLAGVRGHTAIAIVEAVAAEARALGLEVGGRGCKPDVLILVSRDPDAAVERFRRDHRTFFATTARPDELEAGPDRERLGAFLASDAAVRWWHVSRLAASDGRPIEWYESKEKVPGTDDIPTGIFRPYVAGTSASRLSSLWTEEFARILIVVDGRQLEGVSAKALAAYLTMIALAEFPPEPEPQGLPTILTLFDDLEAGRVPEEGLTAYDRAYLCGLYEAPRDVRNLNAHKGAIRRRIVEATSGDAPSCPSAAR